MKPRSKIGTSNKIGQTIERKRKELGLSQKEMIARIQVAGLDIDDASYSKVEGQQRKVCDYELRIIAKVLNVPMESLFEDSLT